MARHEALKIELVLGIEASGGGSLFLTQEPVRPDDPLVRRAGSARIHDEKMVADGIETVGVAPIQRIRAPLARPELIIEDAVTHFLRSGYLILVARQTDFERTDPAQGGSVHDVVRSDARNAPFSIGPGFGGSHFGRRHVCMHERFSFEPSLLARGYSLGATGL